MNSCFRTQQTNSVKWVSRLSPAPGKAPNSRLERVARWRWGARSQRGKHPPNPWDTRPAAGWRGEVHGRPASLRFRGSRSRGLAEPRAGRTVTLFHSATPFCRLLTRQSENTAPSLLLSEVRDVVVFFLFFLPLPHSPSLPFLRVGFSGSCVQCWELASSRDRWQSYQMCIIRFPSCHSLFNQIKTKKKERERERGGVN